MPPTESSYEADKQRFAHSCGLSVPQVLDVTKIDGKQAIVMEYIKGKTIGELFLENMELAEYYIDISIDIQREIHEIHADSLESMSQKLRHKLESAPQLENRQKEKLLKKLDSMTYEKMLCHGDFHLLNLIMSEDQVTIIDWVDASAGDIRADVCRTYLLYSELSSEVAELYLRLYCEKTGLKKDAILQWSPILAGARLTENVSMESTERLLDIVNHYCPVE
ncbi:aminoglycoside phosphotransferase family protein [Sporosarcina thermotolerans]|uniref:Aminoglycoside phosphotransferase family protein n=1 Tax=Sporosarcina thermotolerans TaxID=633404 RepID=A0AAW9ADP4_9BACL|nr:aminoglycoside phosphotransferase family protein [Sporosarcina thermotolerans]MDW0117756.1 aminoglycoside phosphotransferase family protein [Sporosarcina thermotolerans]